MIVNCRFCHKPADYSYMVSTYSCHKHGTNIVHSYFFDKEIVIECHYNEKGYSLRWRNSKLAVWDWSADSSILQAADIPMVPPEQADQLLKRILFNLSFT